MLLLPNSRYPVSRNKYLIIYKKFISHKVLSPGNMLQRNVLCALCKCYFVFFCLFFRHICFGVTIICRLRNSGNIFQQIPRIQICFFNLCFAQSLSLPFRKSSSRLKIFPFIISPIKHCFYCPHRRLRSYCHPVLSLSASAIASPGLLTRSISAPSLSPARCRIS